MVRRVKLYIYKGERHTNLPVAFISRHKLLHFHLYSAHPEYHKIKRKLEDHQPVFKEVNPAIEIPFDPIKSDIYVHGGSWRGGFLCHAH